MSARRHITLLLVTVCALALHACGGDEVRPKAAPGTPQNPLVAARPGETTATGASKAGTRIPQGEPSARRTTAPTYKGLLERQSSKPGERFTPCNLVTQREAERIIGERLERPVEGLQGPTCIYKPRSGRAIVALAVHQTRFRSIRSQIEDLRRVDIAGKRGYCGTHGQPMLYVPLPGGRLLSVSAKCAIARGFAAKALPNL